MDDLLKIKANAVKTRNKKKYLSFKSKRGEQMNSRLLITGEFCRSPRPRKAAEKLKYIKNKTVFWPRGNNGTLKGGTAEMKNYFFNLKSY